MLMMLLQVGLCLICMNVSLLLFSRGPAFGYFPRPTKSFVVVSERFKGEAEAVFGGLCVHVVTGHKFLGGFIGSLSARDDYVLSKVHKWAGYINILVDVALTQPQLAYAALVHSLQHEWTFLLCVIPHCGPLLGELEKLLASCFLPALFGVEVSVAEHDLLALPLGLGGLGVSNLVSSASYLYDSSLRSIVVLVKSLVSAMLFELDAHFEAVSLAKVDYWKLMDSVFTEQFDRLLPSFVSNQCYAILQARDSNTSSWLSSLPLERSQFDLSVQEFRDGLSLHYRKPLLCLPAACDGCGASFNIEHALDCRYGGFVGHRHSEVHDAFSDLASLIWSPVYKEPVVCDRSAGNSDTLIADLCVCGVWQQGHSQT